MDPSVSQFSMDMFSLKGKVAIVTGGNTTLGMGYSVAFAKAGADIFIPHFLDDIGEVKAAVEAEGRRIEFLKGNLMDKELRQMQWKGILDKTLGKIGRTQKDALGASKSTKWKIAVAKWMKLNTQASNGWLSEQLNLGNAGNFSRKVSPCQKNDETWKQLKAKLKT